MLRDVSVVTPPANSPISLDDAREHARIDGSVEDARLLGMINGAVGDLDGKDGWLGRALITQTLKLTMDRFPSRKIKLPLPPLQSVSSVTYLDSDEVEQTVAAADYRVIINATPGFIELQSDKSWPSVGPYSDAVRIEYVAGYGDESAVPQPIKEWLLATVADRFDNRAPTVIGAPSSRLSFTDRMLDSFVVRTSPGS